MTASPETKLTKFLRNAMSFILAVIISILGMAAFANACVLKDTNIEKRFSSYEYADSVRADVVEYAKSVYVQNGLDYSNIESIITLKAVSNTVGSYAGHYISYRVGYDEDAYLLEIEGICKNINADISKQADKVYSESDDEIVNKLTQSIKDYFIGVVEIEGVERLRPILNVGIPATYAIIGISAFFFIFITLILAFLGERRYRSIRAISNSFLTAGMFEICLGLIVHIISDVKKLDIYPVYFATQVMNFVSYAVRMVVVTGLLTMLIALMILVFAWINKMKGKR